MPGQRKDGRPDGAVPVGEPPPSPAAGKGEATALARVVGVPGAVLLGLGSILGTGVFVSIGLAAGVAGAGLLPALVLAAGLALLNGLSSAQLAALHPVSGGTYEYGYRRLAPVLGFTAGWMFLCAKSASAATAALGLAGYVLRAMGSDAGGVARSALAAGFALAITLLVAGGLRRSNAANAIVVTIAIAALVVFSVTGWTADAVSAPARADAGIGALLEATALMFVAYTGYGRIATLGEEVRDPAHSIPRAIVWTLLVSLVVYVAVGSAALRVLGPDTLAEATRTGAAPLAVAAATLGRPGVALLVTAGALAALVGVLLNLVLGLSRVVLAMARRGDMPARLAGIDARTLSPRAAVFATGALVAGLTLIGDVGTTWSFSAFTVLLYYGITHLAALRIPAAQRRYPTVVAVVGLAGCGSLAFFVDTGVILAGFVAIAAGLAWHGVARRRVGGASPYR